MPNDIISPALLDQSILFARFAGAAYTDRDVRNVPQLARATNEQRFDEKTTDTQAMVCIWNNDIVLSVRGTEGKLSDWMTDLKGKLIKNSDGVGRVHEGFQTAADSIIASITKYISNLADSKSRLFVCGHSLGGALAQIFAERLSRNPKMPKIGGVFTYGSPRVGDEVYVAAYRKSPLGEITYMWVDAKDPVARVAPHSFEYRHAVSKQLTFDKFGEIRWTDLDLLGEQDKSADQLFLAGVIGAFSRLKNTLQNFDASKHSIEHSYLENLENARSRAKTSP